MLVLGIESSCDETACAIVRNGNEILSNIIASQAELHEAYGGVVPEIASRQHAEVIIPVIDQALKEAGVTLDDIDLIAVAHAPGLIGALLVGLNAAKALSLALNIPFVAVNHVEAHLYAAVMSHDKEHAFPCLGAVFSGGHTALVLMRSFSDYTVVAKTVDDAIGEAFDKVAKAIGLPYPGGPLIEKLAREGNPKAHPLKAGRIKERPHDFSYSGLKTGVLYTLKGQNMSAPLPVQLTHSAMCDIAASFQHTAFTDLVDKTVASARRNGCSTILFGGGVTNNMRLREMFASVAPDLDLVWPSAGLSLDNAAMIAGLGFHQYKAKNRGDPLDIEALPTLLF